MYKENQCKKKRESKFPGPTKPNGSASQEIMLFVNFLWLTLSLSRLQGRVTLVYDVEFFWDYELIHLEFIVPCTVTTFNGEEPTLLVFCIDLVYQ